MDFRSRRKRIPVVIVVGLLVSVVAPTVALGQSSTGNSRSTLEGLIAAAVSSQAYANATVTLAAAHGVPVASAQSHLSQGDSFLAQAESDAQAGATAAGIQAAQASMSAYASAAAGASLALTNAGFSLGLDYDAALSAAAEVNRTLSVVSAVSAMACGSASSVVSNSSVCGQANTQLSKARTDLSQASSILAQISGQAQAPGSLLQALAFIAGARTQAQAAVLAISTMASYTYSQRAQAYVSAVVDPLAAQANSTIDSEKTLSASFSQLQADYLQYGEAQGLSVAALTTSASTLATSITTVDIGGLDAASSSAEAVAAQVETDLSALLALPGVTLQTGLVSDINSCQSASSSFLQSVGAVVSGTNAFQTTKLSAFQTYAAAFGKNASEAEASGGAYVSAYDKVVSDLASAFGVPGVSAIYSNLNSLQVSGSVTGLDGSLKSGATSVDAVQSDAAAFAEAVSAQTPVITPSVSLLSNASADVSAAAPFLSGTGASVVSSVSPALLEVQQSALNLTDQASLMTTETTGMLGVAAAALVTYGRDATTATNTGGTVISAAAGYLNVDVHARASLVATAQGEVAAALKLFSELDVSGGASAMAQASVDFRAAFATSVG